MEQLGYNSAPGKKGRLALRVLSAIILAVFVFAAGVAVGRGDLDISGLSKKTAGTSNRASAFDYSSVDKIYGILHKNFDGKLDREKLLDGIKTGLVGATGDPYTEYFNPKDAEEFNSQLSGSFTGIGAELGADSNGKIVIVAPLSGYPAEKAGLRPKDVVAAVDGQSTSGQAVGEVVRKIRGAAGTNVKLTIVRSGSKAFDVSITRTKITVPSVKSEAKDGIGYLKISQFTSDTEDLVKAAATDFKAKKIKGIVLDLRSNPGGYLDSAVAISSMWLENDKRIVSESRGSTVLSTKYSSGPHPFKGLPTVVLINNGSASAAEITAGALRDNGTATLVGDKSFGKGSVQEVEDLPGGAELKVTIAHWYTPKGKNINKQGIAPDVEVKISDADQKAGRDPQKDRAYEILRNKISQGM